MFSGPTRATRAALLFGLASAGLALAPQAASAAGAPGTYSASISPNVAPVGTSTTFTVTFANTSSSTAEIKKAQVKFPTGFTITSVGAPTPATFTVTQSGPEVMLSGVLRPGASVSVPITATTPTTPAGYPLPTSIVGAGTFTNSGSTPTVTVAQAASTVPCPPNRSCSTPTLSVGPTQNFLATGSQVTARSGPQADQLSVVLPDPTAAPMLCQQTNGNFGQIVTWAVTRRTSALVYTVHPTTSEYTYALSDTCFGSTQPFPGAAQNPANGNEFEGTLPYCSVPHEPSQTNPPPCVVSIVTVRKPTDPPAVQVTINAPLGDPKFSG